MHAVGLLLGLLFFAIVGFIPAQADDDLSGTWVNPEGKTYQLTISPNGHVTLQRKTDKGFLKTYEGTFQLPLMPLVYIPKDPGELNEDTKVINAQIVKQQYKFDAELKQIAPNQLQLTGYDDYFNWDSQHRITKIDRHYRKYVVLLTRPTDTYYIYHIDIDGPYEAQMTELKKRLEQQQRELEALSDQWHALAKQRVPLKTSLDRLNAESTALDQKMVAMMKPGQFAQERLKELQANITTWTQEMNKNEADIKAMAQDPQYQPDYKAFSSYSWLNEGIKERQTKIDNAKKEMQQLQQHRADSLLKEDNTESRYYAEMTIERRRLQGERSVLLEKIQALETQLQTLYDQRAQKTNTIMAGIEELYKRHGEPAKHIELRIDDKVMLTQAFDRDTQNPPELTKALAEKKKLEAEMDEAITLKTKLLDTYNAESQQAIDALITLAGPSGLIYQSGSVNILVDTTRELTNFTIDTASANTIGLAKASLKLLISKAYQAYTEHKALNTFDPNSITSVVESIEQQELKNPLWLSTQVDALSSEAASNVKGNVKSIAKTKALSYMADKLEEHHLISPERIDKDNRSLAAMMKDTFDLKSTAMDIVKSAEIPILLDYIQDALKKPLIDKERAAWQQFFTHDVKARQAYALYQAATLNYVRAFDSYHYWYQQSWSSLHNTSEISPWNQGEANLGKTYPVRVGQRVHIKITPWDPTVWGKAQLQSRPMTAISDHGQVLEFHTTVPTITPINQQHYITLTVDQYVKPTH